MAPTTCGQSQKLHAKPKALADDKISEQKASKGPEHSAGSRSEPKELDTKDSASQVAGDKEHKTSERGTEPGAKPNDNHEQRAKVKAKTKTRANLQKHSKAVPIPNVPSSNKRTRDQVPHEEERPGKKPSTRSDSKAVLAPKQPKEPSTFRLQDLPFELRQRIYGLALFNEHGIDSFTRHDFELPTSFTRLSKLLPGYQFKLSSTSRHVPGLLQVSNTIAKEATKPYLEVNTIKSTFPPSDVNDSHLDGRMTRSKAFESTLEFFSNWLSITGLCVSIRTLELPWDLFLDREYCDRGYDEGDNGDDNDGRSVDDLHHDAQDEENIDKEDNPDYHGGPEAGDGKWEATLNDTVALIQSCPNLRSLRIPINGMVVQYSRREGKYVIRIKATIKAFQLARWLDREITCTISRYELLVCNPPGRKHEQFYKNAAEKLRKWFEDGFKARGGRQVEVVTVNTAVRS